MRAPRRFRFGSQFIADQGMHGTVTERYVMLLRQILLNLPITGKPLGLGESGAELF